MQKSRFKEFLENYTMYDPESIEILLNDDGGLHPREMDTLQYEEESTEVSWKDKVKKWIGE